MALYCDSVRTIIFVQAIIIIVYILVMTLFIGIAAKESVDSSIEDAPVKPYSSNSPYTPTTNPVDTPKRMPRATSCDINSSSF